jgi:radical SAM protein with 4Fe4S-binding SPASM domain
MATFEKVLEGCRPSIRAMSLYLHGEPFLHPDLHEMAGRARDEGISTTIYTNGLIVREEQLIRVLRAEPRLILVSMDLISRSGYLTCRGGDFYRKASDQLRMMASVFVRLKSRTRLVLRSIYTGENGEEVSEFIDAWYNTGGISEIQIGSRFPWPKRIDADMLTGKIVDDRAECPQVWNALNVCWDGTVTPCSFDSDASYPLGNIHDAPLNDLLNSREARHFRKMHILGRREQMEMCAHCLLPKFNHEIVILRSGTTQRMDPEKKKALADRVMRLKFSPRRDFPR